MCTFAPLLRHLPSGRYDDDGNDDTGTQVLSADGHGMHALDVLLLAVHYAQVHKTFAEISCHIAGETGNTQIEHDGEGNKGTDD